MKWIKVQVERWTIHHLQNTERKNADHHKRMELASNADYFEPEHHLSHLLRHQERRHLSFGQICQSEPPALYFRTFFRTKRQSFGDEVPHSGHIHRFRVLQGGRKTLEWCQKFQLWIEVSPWVTYLENFPPFKSHLPGVKRLQSLCFTQRQSKKEFWLKHDWINLYRGDGLVVGIVST